MTANCTHASTTIDTTRNSAGQVVRCKETCNNCKTVLRDAH